MSGLKGRMYNLKKAEWKDLEKSQTGLGRNEEKVRVATEKLLAKEISCIKRASALHHNKEKGLEGISILKRLHLPSQAQREHLEKNFPVKS